MTLLQPWWLLLLTLAAVIIALHMRRRRNLPVSSLFLWQRVQSSEVRRPARSWPPPSLPLVLQLLALLLLTLALARPHFGDTGPDHWIALIDTSAAVREHGLAADLPGLLPQHPQAALTLVEVAGQPLVRATRQTDRRILNLDPLDLTDEDSDWLQAIRLLTGLVDSQEDTLVTVIAPPAAAREASQILAELLPSARAEFQIHGPEAANNRFHHVQLVPAGAGWNLSGTVATDATVQVLFRPEGADAAVAVMEISAIAGRFAAHLELPGPGILELRLPDDGLLADNFHLLAVRPAPEPLRVLLTGLPDEALERAVNASGTAEAVYGGQDHDLVIFADAPSAETGIPTLTFLAGQGPAPAFVTAGSSRLVSGLDFRGLALTAADILEAAPADEILLETPAGPVGLLRESASGPQVIFGFSLEASNWTDLPSFPGFIANLLDLLRPDQSCVVGQACRAGTGASVTSPSGEAILLNRVGTFTPKLAGIHLVDGVPLPANIVGPFRSLTASAGNLPPGAADVTAWETWQMLAVLAALVLLVEAALALAASRRKWPGLAIQAAAATLLLLSLSGWSLWNPVLLARRAVLTEETGTNYGMPQLMMAEGQLATGLRLSRGLLPQGGDLVVASGGLLTAGELEPAVRQLQSAGISISAIPLPAGPAEELLVTGLVAPPTPRQGEPFLLTAELFSTNAGPAEIQLFRNGAETESRQIQLEPGPNQVSFTVSDVPGTWLYEVSIAAAADTEPGNNRNGSFVTVGQHPRVAVVTRQTGPGQAFVQALGIQGISAQLLSPVSLPWNGEGFREYDSVVLLDLPAMELHSSQQIALEAWVSQAGGGLLILGGANSYGPGGYYQTELEELSPLSSLVDRESPEVALLFVLDSSGSMDQAVGETNRLEIAKEATLGALRVLGDDSQAGIIMFDTTAQVLVPLQSTADLSPFADALAAVGPSGGTAIHPALVHALEQMRDVDATAKHIVVMTDGLSQPADFAPVLRQLRDLNVTISTVAIGEGADVAGLANIARLGAGATHATTDFRALPSILGQEALLLAGNSVEEQVIRPRWLAGLPGPDFSSLDGLPDLLGFTRTSLKDGAVLHLNAVDAEGEDVPLLATWSHGLGNVAAFASQGAGPWALDWMQLPGFPALWAEVVRWTLPSVVPSGVSVQTSLSGDELIISMTALTPDRQPRNGLELEAVILTPDGSTGDVALLRQSGDGTYTARLLAPEPGVNWLGISSRPGSAEQLEPLDLPVLVPYSAALNYAAADAARLELMAAETGGTMLTDTKPEPATEIRWISGPAPVLWLLAGLLVFLLALWLRYAANHRRFRNRTRPAG